MPAKPDGTIEKVAIVRTKLDEQISQELTTGWMEANANQVQYNGGAEVKIPSMLVDGLANYNKGYKDGKVQLSFVTKRLTQDRGVRFNLDVRDVDETAGIMQMATVMGEFQRTQVVPEIDAYRISNLATTALGNTGYHADGQTITKENVIEEIKKGILAIRNAGFNGQLMIHATWEVIYALEMAKVSVFNTTTFKIGGIDTQVYQIDNCPIIPTDTNRMVTAIELKDGTTEFGYAKGSSAKDINFMIIAKEVPIAITKLDTIRMFDPMQNQTANGWMADYRRFHDIWVLDNKKNGIYVSCKA